MKLDKVAHSAVYLLSTLISTSYVVCTEGFVYSCLL